LRRDGGNGAAFQAFLPSLPEEEWQERDRLMVDPAVFSVIPAKAGIHEHRRFPPGRRLCSWIPAFAGMTGPTPLKAIAL